MNAELGGLKQGYGADIAAKVYAKLEEALTLIQTIKANEGSDCHNELKAASNSVWDAQLHVGKVMKVGEALEESPCIAIAGTLESANRLKLDTSRNKVTVTVEHPTYAALAAVELDKVPVMSDCRHIPRKTQAALARQLFNRLGIKGLSVTTPNYSMASTVDVTVPREPHPGWDGHEKYQHSSYSDMPDDVPAKQSSMRHTEACLRVHQILEVAFPNHDDRSDSQSDYFDRCWSVS